MKKFNVYKVHSKKEPELLFSNLDLITAKQKTQNLGRDTKDYFYGFYDNKTKPNRKSSFSY